MKINKVFCLFEQSGTFKKAFEDMGIHAEDYDIQNEFNQTDHIIDLFSEIDKAYDGEPSVFDDVQACDLVLAFFPCTRFECQSKMFLDGTHISEQKWSDIQKLEYAMKTHEELHKLYMLLCKLFVISNRGGWRMIVENPQTPPHYLTGYFPIKPALIDKDRTENGDYYKKPTQYWFINCEPEQNMFFEALEDREIYTIDNAHRFVSEDSITRQTKRSLMHPQYARRFIRSFIYNPDD